MSLPGDPSKYGKKAFIEPETFIEYVRSRHRLPKFEIPKDIIFFFIPTQLPRMPMLEGAQNKKFFNAKMDILKNGRIGVVSQFGFGAPALAIQLEMLIALGAKRFIGVGTAGSLIGDVNIGDLVLCNKALRDEGVSYHYVPASEYAYPSEKLNQAIRQTCKNKSMKLKEAPTWTTDAIYRETADEVRRYREMGIQTVDMEASAFFSVARHRGAEAASLFAVSDLLTGEEWAPFLHETSAPLTTLLDVAITAFSSD